MQTVPEGKVVPWVPEHMEGRKVLTLEKAIADAQRFDLIAALDANYKDHVPEMKSTNPALTLLAYTKGVITYDDALPSDAYAKGASGHPVMGVQFPGTYLLNPLSDEAQKAQVALCQKVLKRSNFHGLFFDTVGVAPLSAPDYMNEVAIDPRTGKKWEQKTWITDVNAFVNRTKKACDGVPCMTNGLRDGGWYFDSNAPSSITVEGMEAGCCEGWLRGATASVTAWPKEAKWKQNVDAMVDCEKKGICFGATLKLWVSATEAQIDEWYRYAVATFLLGSGGHSRMSFSTSQSDVTAERPFDNKSMGRAKGPYTVAAVNKQNVYTRKFDNGTVQVTPATHKAVVTFQ